MFTPPFRIAALWGGASLAVNLVYGVVAAAEPKPVVVTATRTAETTDETLAPVTIIDREAIEQLQPQSMADLLQSQPGIDISRYGGLGATTSVRLRGTESDHVLVLIDGVRAASTTTGTFTWEHLDPSQIERIEIVRGPRAGLYGSDAIGGVIQIFTRDSDGPSARLQGGSFQTYRAQAGFGTTGETRFSVNGNFVRSRGFSATNTRSFNFDPDDDGYEEASLTARFQTTLPGQSQFDVSFWRARGEAEFDKGTHDSINQTFSARWRAPISPTWHQTLRVTHSLDELITDSAFASSFTTSQRAVNWQHDITLGENHLLTAGADYRQELGENFSRVSASTVFDEDTSNLGLYAQLQSSYGANDVQLALRRDHHSQFGSETTGQLAWGRAITPALRATASYGTAFKAPTLNELFHPGTGGLFAGNPDLEPERSRSLELGLRHQPPNSDRRVAAYLFTTRIDNLIAYEGTNFQAINIDEARVRGLELEYVDKRGAWRWQANLTLQRARDESDDSRLLRRADEKLALRVGRELPNGGNVDVEALLVGDRADLSTTLPGYGLVNLSGSYPLSRRLRLEGRVENLLDKEYEQVEGYNTPDRSVFLGIRYQP